MLMWNFIVLCSEFPVLQNIPVHRILPILNFGDALNKLPDIIKNPDFDAFQFQKYIDTVEKVENTCLANKSIHFVMFDYYVDLFEKAALMIYKTQGLKTNITLYINPFLYRKDAFLREKLFWTDYIERREWTNTFTVKYQLDGKVRPLPQQNTDEIFLIDYYISLYGYIVFDRSHLCNEGRKMIFLYDGENRLKEEKMEHPTRIWCKDLDSKCKTNVSLTTLKATRADFFDVLFDEIIKTGCV